MRVNPLYIGGRWIETGSRASRNDLYRGTPFSETCLAEASHVQAAIDAAERGAAEMEAAPAHRRAAWLRAAAARLREREAEIAGSIVAENGKTLALCRREVHRTAETLEFSADEALRLGGEVIPLDASPRGEGKLGFYLRVPVGVVAAITPFNSPLNLLAHKVGPALAAGNAVVAKPDPRTASCAVYLCEVLEKVGLPAGAVNLVHGGPEVGGPLVADPRVRVVSFTGGGAAAVQIVRQAGIKRVLLELGGNAGNIVCADADLDTAAKEMAANAFGYSGQSCIGVQRVYVEKDVYGDFLDRFVARTRALRLGDPWDGKTDVGPVISEEAARRIEEWVHEAVSQGARVVCGGKRDGLLFEPTIVIDVKPSMKVVCEEVFGPVATVEPVPDLDAAIAAVNDSRYGLQAGVFTSSLQSALKCARRIKTGGVVVNGTSNYRLEHQPYGGVKQSGVGREGPAFAIEELTDLRMIVLQ